MEQEPENNSPEGTKLNKEENPKEKTQELLIDFKPFSQHLVTALLIAANVIVFIIMVFSGVSPISPGTEDLLSWGANFKPITLDDQPWRLLASCFLHYGLLHLVMNMFALVFIGTFVEPELGKLRYITAYLLTGILASLSSIIFNKELTVSAGASGAIFGLFGIFLALLITRTTVKSSSSVLFRSITSIIVFNILFGFIIPVVDNAAHIGGAISGLLIGFLFYPSLAKRDAVFLKYLNLLLVTAFTLYFTYITYQEIPNPIGEYDQRISEFYKTQNLAVKAYENAMQSKNGKTISYIEQSINYWEKDLDLIEELDQLELPDFVHQRNGFLKKYCSLRIEALRLTSKSLKENEPKYLEQVKKYDNEINQVIKEINQIDQVNK